MLQASPLKREFTYQGLKLADPNPNRSVVLDVHQVMPNHFHGIIVIPGPGLEPSLARATGAAVVQPLVGPGLAPARLAEAKASLGPTGRQVGLGAVVGAFKSLSAIAVNQALARTGRNLWQEDYYEHIIRNVDELGKSRDYIIRNPARWPEDPENHDVGPGLASAWPSRPALGERRPYGMKCRTRRLCVFGLPCVRCGSFTLLMRSKSCGLPEQVRANCCCVSAACRPRSVRRGWARRRSQHGGLVRSFQPGEGAGNGEGCIKAVGRLAGEASSLT
jgi:REP element-mobilizing transposase RayT